MAFSKKNFVDNQTVIDADTLNAIQDELIRVAAEVDDGGLVGPRAPRATRVRPVPRAPRAIPAPRGLWGRKALPAASAWILWIR